MKVVGKRLICLEVDIFNSDVTVAVNFSEAELRQRLKKTFPGSPNWEGILPGWDASGPGAGRTMMSPAGVVILLRIRSIVSDVGLIAHEMSHAVTQIMSRCSADDDELRSYMLGYLVQKCIDHIHVS